MIKLDANEYVVLKIRKHWFYLLTEIAFAIILILLPIFLLPLLELIGLRIDISSGSLILFFYFSWVLFLWLFICIIWTNYYLDVWIVTNVKIFDVEQHGLFSREVSNLHYEKIQDVTFEIRGLIYSLLNLGDVHVQNAGTQRNFTIKGVKDPAYVQRKINEILLRKEI